MAAQAARSFCLARGVVVFNMYCHGCHGQISELPALPPGLTDLLRDLRYGSSAEQMFEVVSTGTLPKGGSALMAGWGSVISESDRWALVAHIRCVRAADGSRDDRSRLTRRCS
jgi:mono/diheme cytochrome c family protein